MNAPAKKLIKTIKIDLAQQLVEAFLGAVRVLRFECVSGDKDHPTDGKALHQYHGIVPLRVVRTVRSGISEWFGSHGCVRLTHADAKTLYQWAPLGTTVKVS